MKQDPGVYYEEFTLDQVNVAEYLFNIWERSGMPDTPFSAAGKQVMEAIFDAWQVILPQEVIEWKRERDEYQANEMTIKQQVRKGTGRTLASYPPLVYTLIKKMFPNLKMDRTTHIKLAREYPMLKFANRIWE